MINQQHILAASWGSTVKFRFSMALNERVGIMGPRESLQQAVFTRNDSLEQLGMPLPDDDHHGWLPKVQREEAARKVAVVGEENERWVDEEYGPKD